MYTTTKFMSKSVQVIQIVYAGAVKALDLSNESSCKIEHSCNVILRITKLTPHCCNFIDYRRFILGFPALAHLEEARKSILKN